MPDFEREFRSFYRTIQRDRRLKGNLEAGEPRPGHPEGTIKGHVAELEANLSLLKGLKKEEYWKARILALAHDAFKPESKPRAPIEAPDSHASIATMFLMDRFVEFGWGMIPKRGAAGVKSDLLYMCQYHDEPYAIWRKRENSKGKGFDKGRMARLVERIGDWDTFLAFVLADGITEGKDAAPTKWFLKEARKMVKTRVDEKWLKRLTQR